MNRGVISTRKFKSVTIRGTDDSAQEQSKYFVNTVFHVNRKKKKNFCHVKATTSKKKHFEFCINFTSHQKKKTFRLGLHYFFQKFNFKTVDIAKFTSKNFTWSTYRIKWKKNFNVTNSCVTLTLQQVEYLTHWAAYRRSKSFTERTKANNEEITNWWKK